ncbi:MAG TPA: chaperone modulator CbpM [Candidatus Binatia bacterium]|jgi:DNA-binding transcriptional MerR regulator|nr:chaperone modulator CbpM [Candidatus Binatia bacterium]
MNKKYFRLSEVMEICEVSEKFVLALERENLIRFVRRKRVKLYPLDQLDRIRVAHVLVKQLGVNLQGVEVALHLRQQVIDARRELASLLSRVRNQT